MDLFEEDKRLFLAPVRAFDKSLMGAFTEGACTCIRCRDGAGAQVGYKHLHTFDIAGGVFRRRFAGSTQSDIRGALSKAWEAYYKTALPVAGEADLSAITAMTQGEASRRVGTLLYASGVIADVEGKPHFAPMIA
ncbi:hypothetical protein [Pseudomonas sp. NPDC090208]|uniref:hypothetical protein n=1 Tax=Pseudomonas sp. NPDC090208 TaxID=3364478 RepID=UPI0037FFF869